MTTTTTANNTNTTNALTLDAARERLAEMLQGCPHQQPGEFEAVARLALGDPADLRECRKQQDEILGCIEAAPADLQHQLAARYAALMDTEDRLSGGHSLPW